MTDISNAQDGTLPTYWLTLTRSGLPLPLAGATAHLIAIHTQYPVWEIRKQMEVENPLGVLVCRFAAEDTVHPGTYNVTIRILWGDGLRALNGSHRYAAACAADLYEIPVEIIPEDALTVEQIERLDREYDTDGFVRALEEFAEEGAVGLDAALEIMRAEVEQECASRS